MEKSFQESFSMTFIKKKAVSFNKNQPLQCPKKCPSSDLLQNDLNPALFFDLHAAQTEMNYYEQKI